MDSVNLGESSGGLSGVPAKRRRGRPPKDPSRKQAEAAQVFHGLGAKQPCIPESAGRSGGIEGEVGQTVTGVVEAAFEAGYLLSVRIGDSNINMKGVVFKPGYSVPITPENDIAPHVPMIRRNDVHFPSGNLGQNTGMQTAATALAKRKYKSRKTSASIPPASPNGIFTPVILKPVKNSSGTPKSDHEDEAVHMVEPLSVLPPDQSVPAGQIFMSTQGYSNHQVVAPGSEHEDVSLNEATSEEKSKQMTPTDVDTPGSSHTSDTKTDDGNTAKSSPEDSGVVSKQEPGKISDHFLSESSVPMSSASVMKPFFNYGTGNMTELLQAQENMKDTQVQFAEPSFPTGFEYLEPTVEFDPKNQVSKDSKAA